MQLHVLRSIVYQAAFFSETMNLHRMMNLVSGNLCHKPFKHHGHEFKPF